MKTVLVALNARYYHMNLAVRSLAASCQAQGLTDVSWWEAGIDMPRDALLRSLYEQGADCIAFSCYLWNIELVLQMASSLRQIQPDLYLLLGGPEVSYDAETFLTENSAIDAVLCGECEQTLPTHLRDLKADVPGLVRRGMHADGRVGRVEALDMLPFAYTKEELARAGDRILYYETSRGCPFHCGYCLSSRTPGVRTRSLVRVRAELEAFVKAGVPLVKLVDRTFNADEARARELLRMIMEMGGHTQFHFEVAGHLLQEETLQLLTQAPKGLFRLEIGVQSTDPAVLRAVTRRTDTAAVERNVRRLVKAGRTEVHVDLIAGLPGEDARMIQRSFDDVFAWQPDMLQLGFLKLLRGCKIREEAALYGYAARPFPPYEVLAHDALSFVELCRVKDACWALDKLYNASGARTALRYLLQGAPSAFEVFAEIGARYHAMGETRLSYDGVLRIAYEAGCARGANAVWLRELLRYDHRLKERRLGAEWLAPWRATEDEMRVMRQCVRDTSDAAYADRFAMDPVCYAQTGSIVEIPCYVAFDGKGNAWKVCDA